jgi:hypothetical protein
MRRYVKTARGPRPAARVDAPLRARRGDTELQALMALLQRNDGPGLLLEGVEGINTQGLPVLFNPFGSHQRTALMLGAETWDEARNRYVRIAADPSTWHEPVVVPQAGAPCREHIIRDVDLRRDLPHVWFGKEGASFVTGAVVITFATTPTPASATSAGTDSPRSSTRPIRAAGSTPSSAPSRTSPASSGGTRRCPASAGTSPAPCAAASASRSPAR